MSGVTGDFAALRALRKSIASLPEANAAIARRAAPKVTAEFLASFDAQQSPYGNPWKPGRKGPITLNRSGRLRSGIRFIPIGTRLRSSLGAPYARFHIHRGLLPRGGSALPAKWDEAIGKEATAELNERMGLG